MLFHAVRPGCCCCSWPAALVSPLTLHCLCIYRTGLAFRLVHQRHCWASPNFSKQFHPGAIYPAPINTFEKRRDLVFHCQKSRKTTTSLGVTLLCADELSASNDIAGNCFESKFKDARCLFTPLPNVMEFASTPQHLYRKRGEDIFVCQCKLLLFFPLVLWKACAVRHLGCRRVSSYPK